MEYINCFQITSLVLVTMIAIHYFSHKRLNNAENRNFVCFLAFSGVYVLLDMLSAVIAGGGSSEGCRMSALVLTLYYFCDVILTYGLFCYIRIVTGRQKEKYKWLQCCWQLQQTYGRDGFFILTRKVDLSGEVFIFCSMDMYSFLCW